MRLSATTYISFLLCSLLSSVSASQDGQIVMDAESQRESPVYVPQTTLQPTLSDLLTIEPSASIFYSYARELEMSSMLSDHDAKLTIFVPTNKAVMGLSRKPHESPETDGDIELSEEQFHDKAKSNVERWVSAHIVPEYPLAFDTNEHSTMLHHKSISFKPISKVGGHGADWARVTLENGIKIVGKKAGLNGDMYLIDGTISLD